MLAVEVQYLRLQVLDVIEPPRLRRGVAHEDERQARKPRERFAAAQAGERNAAVRLLRHGDDAVREAVEGVERAGFRGDSRVGVVVDVGAHDDPVQRAVIGEVPVGDVERVPEDPAQGGFRRERFAALGDGRAVGLQPAPTPRGEGGRDALHEGVHALALPGAVGEEGGVRARARGLRAEDILVDLAGDAPGVVDEGGALLASDDAARGVAVPRGVRLVGGAPEAQVDVRAPAVDRGEVAQKLRFADLDYFVLAGGDEVHDGPFVLWLTGQTG